MIRYNIINFTFPRKAIILLLFIYIIDFIKWKSYLMESAKLEKSMVHTSIVKKNVSYRKLFPDEHLKKS